MKYAKYILPVLLLGMVIGSSSCKKDKSAKALVRVLKDSVNFVTGDTVEVAAIQANVRFYLDVIGAEHIDTVIRTDTKGEALFSWFEDAIIQYDITYGSYTNLENFVILKQGETQEVTVNIDDP